ncbi:hypothetical protein [Streptococcus intermedius]|jgi:lipoprotein|uniref:Lipoprotein n=1 Tax=Streptococcus intermedius TaxID=1338 RepID=A0AAE8G486_STRIT|nr:hypothetical protein [Streptococcus intermedius]RSJ23704.1 hypothetical protein D8827_04135 [Streptococcus intermedius]
MKKKVLFLVTMIAAAIFMVSCGNKTASLDGEYYFYADYRNGISKSPWVVIEGKTLTYYSGGKDKPSGTLRFSIDFEKKTLTGENKVITYSYDKENGILSAGIESGNAQFIKKDSKKYKELKKTEKD